MSAAASNVLQFALGIETAGFLEKIGVGERAIVGMEVAAEVCHTALEGMMAAMENGIALDELSARTGETTKNLYLLQQALAASGASAGDASEMIYYVQKALSGVNEMGGQTTGIFTAMGLDRQKLAAESPLDAILQITAALHKMNATDAAGAASGLFGRNGSGDMLAMAGSADEVARALKSSADQAAVFSQTASVFRGISDEVKLIRSDIEAFYAVLAGAIAPEVKSIEDSIAGISFTHIGTNLAEAVKQGHLEELLGDIFSAAVEQFGNMIFSKEFWIGFSDSILGAFGMAEGGIMKIILNIGIALKSVFDVATQELLYGLSEVPGVGKMLGISHMDKPASFADVYAQNKKDNAPANAWIDQFTSGGKDMFLEGFRELGKVIQDSAHGPEHDKLESLWSLLSIEAKANAPKEEEKKSTVAAAAGTENHYQQNPTTFEKMGFVMDGAGSSDVMHRVADNTQRANGILEKMSLNIATLVTGMPVSLLGGVTHQV